MLAAGEVPTCESYTTIISINFKDFAFVGADSRISTDPYGEVSGNAYDKIIRVCEGFLLLCSGCSDVTDELRWTLPHCFSARKPKSFEDALDRVVGWVNFFSEYIRSDVKLILIGSVGDEPMKTGAIDKMDGVVGHVHNRSLVKFKVHSMGSGRQIAQKDIGIQRNKAFLNKKGDLIDENGDLDVNFEKEGIKIIQRALKKASGIDWCTGGRLRAVCMTRKGDTEYLLRPRNPDYCKSNFDVLLPKKKLYETNEANEEKRKGKRKMEEVDVENLKRKKANEITDEEKRKGKRKMEEVDVENLKRKKRSAGGIVIKD